MSECMDIVNIKVGGDISTLKDSHGTKNPCCMNCIKQCSCQFHLGVFLKTHSSVFWHF